MKKIGFICAIILGLAGWLKGQSMVGLSKEEVIAHMKADYKDFHKDESVIKQRFNYLKYVNRQRSKTWIIYFTDQDICKTSKVVCDYSHLNEVLEDINSRYQKTGEFRWEYPVNTDTFQVELIKQDWYFTLRETRKETGGSAL